MSHAPKQLALDAYLDGALSPARRAQVERHLDDCAVCRGACARMRRYRETAEAVRAMPPPDIGWARIEASCARASKPPGALGERLSRLWLWPALAVAAALALTWLRPSAPPPDGPVAAPIEPTPPPLPPPLTGLVTFAANQVTLQQEHVHRDLAPDDALTEGSVVRTGPEGRLHVRLAEGTGVALGPDTALRLAELREGRFTLDLLQGRVDCEVAPLREDGHFVVATANHAAHVRGTRFGYQRGAQEEQVSVAEGTVEVRRGDQALVRLGPGERWSSAPAEGPAQAAQAGGHEPRVLGLQSDATGWAFLRMEPLPEVRAWLPLGAPIEAAGSLHMRHPLGPGSLRVLDTEGRLIEVPFELAEGGRTLTEADVRAALPTPEPPTVGTLPLEQIQPVVRRGLSGLRACYERALREGSVGGAAVTLKLEVGPRGDVRTASAEGPELPAALLRCVETRARSWRFPTPRGGPVRLELPVNLKPRTR